jgi:hypothetical protein
MLGVLQARQGRGMRRVCREGAARGGGERRRALPVGRGGVPRARRPPGTAAEPSRPGRTAPAHTPSHSRVQRRAPSPSPHHTHIYTLPHTPSPALLFAAPRPARPRASACLCRSPSAAASGRSRRGAASTARSRSHRSTSGEKGFGAQGSFLGGSERGVWVPFEDPPPAVAASAAARFAGGGIPVTALVLPLGFAAGGREYSALEVASEYFRREGRV